MEKAIDRITLCGFKSIESLRDFELRNLNVLIGANGAGKSNFVDFFRLLSALAKDSLRHFTSDSGGGDSLFFLGPKVTNAIQVKIEYGTLIYEFELQPTDSGTVRISKELVRDQNRERWIATGPRSESTWSVIATAGSRERFGEDVLSIYESLSSIVVYHFHDTSPLAAVRRDQALRDYERFRNDASNIAPFLLNLKEKHPASYELIRDTIRLIAPFFDDFMLRPVTKGPNELVRLEWRQRGSDFPFQPSQLSDGTLRFICLATALLQPNLPATIVVDEPELGLHPFAISIVADLFKSAAERTQVIVSTQSPTLLDFFEPNQIITVNRQEGRSTFERLDGAALAEWMEDYSVGELWQKNVVRGGPTRE